MMTTNVKEARKLVEESLRLWREMGDKWWIAVTLELAALIMTLDDFQPALAYLEEGVALAREIEDPWPLAVCLIRFGDALKPRGEATAARPFLEEGVVLARRIGDKSVLSEGLRELGSIYYSEGDLTAATSITEEALAEGRAMGSLVSVGLALFQLVVISCLQNDLTRAKRYCFELLTLSKDTGILLAAVFALFSFGLAASFGGEPRKGARLLGATERMLREGGVSPSKNEPTMVVLEQALEKAQAQLGPAAFQTAWTDGQKLTLEHALTLASENESEDLRA